MRPEGTNACSLKGFRVIELWRRCTVHGQQKSTDDAPESSEICDIQARTHDTTPPTVVTLGGPPFAVSQPFACCSGKFPVCVLLLPQQLPLHCEAEGGSNSLKRPKRSHVHKLWSTGVSRIGHGKCPGHGMVHDCYGSHLLHSCGIGPGADRVGQDWSQAVDAGPAGSSCCQYVSSRTAWHATCQLVSTSCAQ